MTIDQFLDALEAGTLDADPATKHQIHQALDNLPKRPGNEGSIYFDSETGAVNREMELTDDFVELVQHEIEVLTQDEPISENTFLGFGAGGSYQEYVEATLRAMEDGLDAMCFLDRYRSEPSFIDPDRALYEEIVQRTGK